MFFVEVDGADEFFCGVDDDAHFNRRYFWVCSEVVVDDVFYFAEVFSDEEYGDVACAAEDESVDEE